MTDSPKLTKRRKLDENTDAKTCQICITPGHEQEICYFGAKMENCLPKWNLTEAKKKIMEAYKQARKRPKPKIERPHQSSLGDSN